MSASPQARCSLRGLVPDTSLATRTESTRAKLPPEYERVSFLRAIRDSALSKQNRLQMLRMVRPLARRGGGLAACVAQATFRIYAFNEDTS